MAELEIMCGRFKAGFEFREIKVRWQLFNDLDFTPHYNIAPTQTHPIIVERAGAVEARPMRWGLVPYWAKDQAIGNKMINALRDSGGKAGFQRPSFLAPLSRTGGRLLRVAQRGQDQAANTDLCQRPRAFWFRWALG